MKVLLSVMATTAWAFQAPMTTTKRTVQQKAVFFEAEGDLSYVKITHDSGASAKVYLYGADLTSYKDAEGTEWIAVRPDAKLDGSKPISGGASHCFPQFGPGAIQQHGFARNVDWDIVEAEDDFAVFELKPSEYTAAMWDYPFKCRYKVGLTPYSLETSYTVMNTGKDGLYVPEEEAKPRPPPVDTSASGSIVSGIINALKEDSAKEPERDLGFDFQCALHTYFDISSIGAVSVAGSFEGASYIDKTADPPATLSETRKEITIAEEYDRVYLGVNDPVLKDTGKKKKLAIKNDGGFQDTVIWSPYGNRGMGFEKFLCVESVAYDPVHLNPGESWSASMTLIPDPIDK